MESIGTAEQVEGAVGRHQVVKRPGSIKQFHRAPGIYQPPPAAQTTPAPAPPFTFLRGGGCCWWWFGDGVNRQYIYFVPPAPRRRDVRSTLGCFFHLLIGQIRRAARRRNGITPWSPVGRRT